jgi:phosphatidylglycerol---prolipoprotein diacylglyceryl transferase
MMPVLQIGPLAIQTPGLILLLGLWLGLTLSEKYAPRFQVDVGKLYNLVFLSLVAGIVGGRLIYAANYPSIFLSHPLSLFSLSPGLFDLTGGLAAALIVGLIYANRKNMLPWNTLDAVTPLLGLMAVAIGSANIASGNAFGAPTDLPWGIHLWGASRHPTQIYETIAAVVILLSVIIWVKKDWPSIPGLTFLSFVALTSGARLFLEAFRGDSLLLPFGFRAVQIVALIVLSMALWGLRRRWMTGIENAQSGA